MLANCTEIDIVDIGKKMPTTTTTVAHKGPTTMIFKWVRRSAL
jgi:hypothetical protein